MSRIVLERNKVENNLKGLRKQLDEYQLKLKKTRKDEVQSMEALKNIRTQIVLYERLIGESQTYLNSLNREIGYLHNQLDVNRRDYGRVSTDFQRVAVAAYKFGGNRDAEMVFASGSVNDAFVRARYMGFISRSVKHKVYDLQSSAQRLDSTRTQLEESYRQKQVAMKAQEEQLKNYASTRVEKEAVLSSIKQNKQEYSEKITEVRKKQQALQAKIESLIMAQQTLIQKEQERARQAELQRKRERLKRIADAQRIAEARRIEAARMLEVRRQEIRRREIAAAIERRRAASAPPAPAPAPEPGLKEVTKIEIKPLPPLPPLPPPPPPPAAEAPAEPQKNIPDVTESEIVQVSADFDKSMGRLPWPVKNGVIVRKFGSKRDRELNIVTTSNGIDISVPAGTPVKAVSGGKVAQIAFLPTFGNVVIIRHPNSYLTVYANLTHVTVAKGEVIRSQHLLGSSGSMPEGASLVHFEIWKGKVKQNPEQWIHR